VALVMAMKQLGLGLILISENNLKKQKVWDASLATKKRGKFMLFTVSLSTCLQGFGNTDYVVCIFVGGRQENHTVLSLNTGRHLYVYETDDLTMYN
jgi:hypothetical protein